MAGNSFFSSFFSTSMHDIANWLINYNFNSTAERFECVGVDGENLKSKNPLKAFRFIFS